MRRLILGVLLAALAGPCMAVAANFPPKFNVAPGCKAAAAINQVMDLSVAQNYKSCMDDEEDARQQLVQNWSSFSSQDQARCVGQTQVNGMPSYAEVLACLQVTANSPLLSTEKKTRTDAKNENKGEKTTRSETTSEKTGEKANDLNATITGLRADVANSGRRIAELEKQNRELKETIVSLKTSVAESTGTITQLQNNNRDSDQALKKAEQERLAVENQLHELEDADAPRSIGEHNAGRNWQGAAYVAFGGLITLVVIDALYLLIRRKGAKHEANRVVKRQPKRSGLKAEGCTAVLDMSAKAGTRPMATGVRQSQASATPETVSN